MEEGEFDVDGGDDLAHLDAGDVLRAKHGPRRFDHTVRGDKLYVVTPITNPQRYGTRYRLFFEYKERMNLNPMVQLVVVEAAFGNRPHVVTKPDDRWDVQLRTDQEIWHKVLGAPLPLPPPFPNDVRDAKPFTEGEPHKSRRPASAQGLVSDSLGPHPPSLHRNR